MDLANHSWGSWSVFTRSAIGMDDRELWREMEKHHLDSFGWARCCCARKGGDAEDVLQAAYLKVLEGQARFGERTGFKTWLFGVIKHTAAEERRKNLVRRLRLAVFRPTGSPERPDQDAQRSEEQTIFERALGELPRRQGEVMHLIFYQAMSLSE